LHQVLSAVVERYLVFDLPVLSEGPRELIEFSVVFCHQLCCAMRHWCARIPFSCDLVKNGTLVGKDGRYVSSMMWGSAVSCFRGYDCFS